LTVSVVSVLVLAVVCGTVCFPILRRLLRAPRPSDLTAEWLSNFSVASYSAMEGLLNAEDFSFLSQQPGFDLSLYRKLRRERLEIFHLYLHKMIADFNRLHLAARMVLAQSRQDQSALLKRLIWLKVRFSASVLQAEFNYHLCRLGVRSLPARHLILYLEQLSAAIGSSEQILVA
jgi:hypothetical protein